ncbi:MAG: hypothetical protein JSW68_13460, partial [Burkholderiales bacterium]
MRGPPHVVADLDAGPMTPLGGLDGLLLGLETPATPMHIGALHLCDLPRGYRGDFATRLRRTLAQRLQVAPVFHRRLARMPLGFANPVWIDCMPDLDHHVRRVRVEPPGDLPALLARVAALHEQLLDRSRPLWMLYVFEGLDGIAPRAPAASVRAFYLKAHHAALDGEAGAALGDMLFDHSAAPRRRTRAPAATADAMADAMADATADATADAMADAMADATAHPRTAASANATAGATGAVTAVPRAAREQAAPSVSRRGR